MCVVGVHGRTWESLKGDVRLRREPKRPSFFNFFDFLGVGKLSVQSSWRAPLLCCMVDYGQ